MKTDPSVTSTKIKNSYSRDSQRGILTAIHVVWNFHSWLSIVWWCNVRRVSFSIIRVALWRWMRVLFTYQKICIVLQIQLLHLKCNFFRLKSSEGLTAVFERGCYAWGHLPSWKSFWYLLCCCSVTAAAAFCVCANLSEAFKFELHFFNFSPFFLGITVCCGCHIYLILRLLVQLLALCINWVSWSNSKAGISWCADHCQLKAQQNASAVIWFRINLQQL